MPWQIHSESFGKHAGITPGQVAYRISKYGMTQDEVAAFFGVSESAISQMRKRHGIKCKNGSFIKTRRKYARCAAAGMTMQETADYLGVKISTVYTAKYTYGLRFAKAVRQ